MSKIDVLKAQIVRQGLNSPWGFRVQRADTGQPLIIYRVTPGSPAARIGLKSGDEITEIGDVPTHRLSVEAAIDLINQYGLSLILTIERKAEGGAAAPAPQPVMNTTGSPSPPAHYQTYNMTGARPVAAPPAPRAANPSSGQNYDYGADFQTVVSRPFEPPPTRPLAPPQPQSPPTYEPGYHEAVPLTEEVGLDDEEGLTQSRSFRILQSIMQNEEPAAGSFGLPPQRSATLERQKWERQQNQQQPHSPRIKVFMPQQYNSPMELYSAKNVMETFQNQAEVHLDEMDRREHEEAAAQY
eukprot:GHVU01003705.1.p1 GENE.GHVU01003705.1~~GHVU01003705.1.p1  ORF type:complete len:298 (-),score=35.43 GHVU01003705.1:763-1656(-)